MRQVQVPRRVEATGDNVYGAIKFCEHNFSLFQMATLPTL